MYTCTVQISSDPIPVFKFFEFSSGHFPFTLTKIEGEEGARKGERILYVGVGSISVFVKGKYCCCLSHNKCGGS